MVSGMRYGLKCIARFAPLLMHGIQVETDGSTGRFAMMIDDTKRYEANRPGCKPILVGTKRKWDKSFSGRNVWEPFQTLPTHYITISDNSLCELDNKATIDACHTPNEIEVKLAITILVCSRSTALR